MEMAGDTSRNLTRAGACALPQACAAANYAVHIEAASHSFPRMKSYRAHRLSGPQELVLEEIDLGDPGPGEILIEVRAAGIHLVDFAALSGERLPRPDLPFVPGLEIAGAILACGPGAIGFSPGDRVAGFTAWGGLAERLIAPADAFVRLPDGLSFDIAASLPMAYGGALMALAVKAQLRANQTVLVLGAGGQEGLAAVGIAKMLEATVVAAANGEKRLEAARAQGADHVFDIGQVAAGGAIRDSIGMEHVDVVFDPVGSNATTAALAALAPGGRFIAAGFAGGRPQSLDVRALFSRGAALITANAILEFERDPRLARTMLARVVKAVTDDTLRPRIAAHFPFADVRHAFDYLAARRGLGAVVLTPS